MMYRYITEGYSSFPAYSLSNHKQPRRCSLSSVFIFNTYTVFNSKIVMCSQSVSARGMSYQESKSLI